MYNLYDFIFIDFSELKKISHITLFTMHLTTSSVQLIWE